MIGLQELAQTEMAFRRAGCAAAGIVWRVEERAVGTLKESPVILNSGSLPA